MRRMYVCASLVEFRYRFISLFSCRSSFFAPGFGLSVLLVYLSDITLYFNQAARVKWKFRVGTRHSEQPENYREREMNAHSSLFNMYFTFEIKKKVLKNLQYKYSKRLGEMRRVGSWLYLDW